MKKNRFKYKISIISPIYNVEKYIVEAVDSTLNQTIGFENLQIILVNDGSTDRTKEILEARYSKYENINIINLEHSSGAAGGPRNIGLDNALGEYIMFLDPDDIYEKTACSDLYEFINRHNSDIVMGQYIQFDSNGSSRPKIFSNALNREIVNVDITRSEEMLVAAPSIWSKIYKTSFIKSNEIRFPEKVAAQDAVFAIEVLLTSEKISFMPKNVYKYRKREGSITQELRKKYFEDFNVTRRLIIDVYENNKKVNYYRIRYIHDLKFLIQKLREAYKLSNEEKICILKELKWFILESKNMIIKEKGINKFIAFIKADEYFKALEFIYEIRLYKRERLFYLKKFIKGVINVGNKISKKNYS